MNVAHNQKLNPDQSLSFEDASKLFSLPLSEAADILGVSTSVLKKICNENGLERWPHRKHLAGKSIEEIKKEAAKEKSKPVGGILQVDKQKGNATTGSHVKDKTLRPPADMSKSPSNVQQPGSRSVVTWRAHHILASGLTIETSTCLDEFKYGFPSSGLSRSANKWWGNASESDDNEGGLKEDLKTDSDVKHASEADNVMVGPICDMQEKVLLSAVRKRAVDEGRQALELGGVLKKYGVDKLAKEEKILLHRLFQTS